MERKITEVCHGIIVYLLNQVLVSVATTLILIVIFSSCLLINTHRRAHTPTQSVVQLTY